tara:strand:+ start:996 stop:1598 length:603 start_codon:yes stop_codon:yes gene_type:complete
MKKYILIPILLLSFLAVSQNNKEKDIDENRNKGYFNITKFSYVNVNKAELETYSEIDGVRVTDLPIDKASAFSLQTINGYFFSPYFSAGLGIGLDGYSNPNINTMPLFIDLRLYLSEQISSMYLYTDFGSLIKIENGPKRGRMFNIGAGYKLALSKKNRTTIITDLGYSFKQVSNDGEPIRTSDSKILINGLILSFGIIF